ncbi:Zn(2)-C6 fungal-type domain-containing protein [Fusarium sp. LHS14.1]|nr:Zn(2)-C6 fungal-type domain-containing protein [Fusarium sp. LHS14.1]
MPTQIDDDQQPAAQSRSRKQHTRSRTGCLTCRKRHRRCDERRPVCENCDTAGRQCEYPLPNLPLRERRKTNLPGEQQPWAPAPPAGLAVVHLPRPTRPVGPCLSQQAINMPFRSNELFSYFYDLEDPVDIAPRDKRQGLLQSVMQSPDALRNTMLIAGLHYGWKAGRLQVFESTLLFHKGETMRLVNWLLVQSDSRRYHECIRHIATLCLTECAFGNVLVAETHLNGLMRYMDFHKPPGSPFADDESVEEELANRYVILTYNFIYGFKSRLRDILHEDDRVPPDTKPDPKRPDPNTVQELMHSWHKDEFRGLDIRLKAMKMVPYFFNQLPPNAKLWDIDGTPMLECLTRITETSGFKRNSAHEAIQQNMWLEGAVTRLLLALVGCHIESLSGDYTRGLNRKNRQPLVTSWSGMCSASGLYLHAVLGIWNAGELIESRMHRRVLYIVKQDLERHRPQKRDRRATDLWLWKAYVCAFSLERHLQLDYDQGVLFPLRRIFGELIAEWSYMTEATDWTQARNALTRIVWPESFYLEDMCRVLWYGSVSSGSVFSESVFSESVSPI